MENSLLAKCLRIYLHVLPISQPTLIFQCDSNLTFNWIKTIMMLPFFFLIHSVIGFLELEAHYPIKAPLLDKLQLSDGWYYLHILFFMMI